MTDRLADEVSSIALPQPSESVHHSFPAGSSTQDAVPAQEKRLQQEREQYRLLKSNMEKRRDDFRVYLDQSGVMDKLSKVLLRMFEEPILPADSVAYFKKHVAGDNYFPDVEELERLSREVKELKADITGLTDENKKLKATLGMPLELTIPTSVRLTPSESDPPVVSGVAKEKLATKENMSKDSGTALKDKKKK